MLDPHHVTATAILFLDIPLSWILPFNKGSPNPSRGDTTQRDVKKPYSNRPFAGPASQTATEPMSSSISPDGQAASSSGSYNGPSENEKGPLSSFNLGFMKTLAEKKTTRGNDKFSQLARIRI